MTAYTLMSGQTVPSNAPNAPVPAAIVLAGSPTRARVTFTLNEVSASYSEASLWAQTAVTPYNYTQNIPLLVMAIPPGAPPHVSQELPLNLEYYNFLFAELNLIDPSQSIAASMSMVV
jgi:hypothetical protein